MRQIIYYSAARHPLSAPELSTLLTRARARNHENAVTGVLIYARQSFVQVLEGADDAVAETMERIKTDSRHDGLLVAMDAHVPARSFAHWSMGFSVHVPDAILPAGGFDLRKGALPTSLRSDALADAILTQFVAHRAA